MRVLNGWEQRARALRTETYALYLAYRDPRVPWYARLLAAGLVAYAISPIDLIPDFIPVLGYLDDLIVLPLGIALAIKLIPPVVLAECRAAARGALDRGGRAARLATGAIVGIWLLSGAVATLLLARWLGGG